MAQRFAVFIDGGFVTKQLEQESGHFPEADEILHLVDGLRQHERLAGHELLRIYFYDAPPFDGKGTNPISKKEENFAQTPFANKYRALLDRLELCSDVAVRRGTTVMSGWKLGRKALAELAEKPRPVTAHDLVPNIAQKGVDLRVALDIASVSLKQIVETIVLVSGDSDLVPAMKFARKEGVKVYLQPLKAHIYRDMRVHADFVF